MLAKNYRFLIVNQMGGTIDFSTDAANNSFVINAIGWKFSATGALVYSAELNSMLSPSANLTDGSRAIGADQVNSANLYMGLNCYAEFNTDIAVPGSLHLYYEYSTDGGTTFPSDAGGLVESEDLILVRELLHTGSGVRAINFSI